MQQHVATFLTMVEPTASLINPCVSEAIMELQSLSAMDISRAKADKGGRLHSRVPQAKREA